VNPCARDMTHAPIGTKCPDCGHPTIMHPMSLYIPGEDWPMSDACALCLISLTMRGFIDAMEGITRGGSGVRGDAEGVAGREVPSGPKRGAHTLHPRWPRPE